MIIMPAKNKIFDRVQHTKISLLCMCQLLGDESSNVTTYDGAIGSLVGWFNHTRVWVGGERLGSIAFLFAVLFLCCCYLFCHAWYMIDAVSV